MSVTNTELRPLFPDYPPLSPNPHFNPHSTRSAPPHSSADPPTLKPHEPPPAAQRPGSRPLAQPGLQETQPLIAKPAPDFKPAPNALPAPDAPEKATTASSQTVLAVFSAALLLTSVCNSIFFKQMTNAMMNHPFFLSQLSTLVYIPVFFGIVALRRAEISQEMRAFPKSKFFYMGLFDAIAGVLSMLGAIHTGGGLQALLSNAIIPCTMILASIYLRESFNRNQIIGSAFITIAVAMAVTPLFFGSGGDDETGADNQLIFVLLFVLNNIPSAFGSVYKEAVFTELDMNENYLQAWVALFQLGLGALLVPLNTLSILGRDAIAFSEIPSVLSRGFWCLLGYNMIVPPNCVRLTDPDALDSFASLLSASHDLLPPCDTCHGAWIPVLLYLSANMLYNWLMVVIIKIEGGGASLLYVIMALRLPLVQLAFSSSYIQDPPEQLHLLNVVVLSMILVGLYLYNSSGGSALATSAHLNINWLKVDTIQQTRAAAGSRRDPGISHEEHTAVLRHEWVSKVLALPRINGGPGGTSGPASLTSGELRRLQERQYLMEGGGNDGGGASEEDTRIQVGPLAEDEAEAEAGAAFPFRALLLHAGDDNGDLNGQGQGPGAMGAGGYGAMGSTRHALAPSQDSHPQSLPTHPTDPLSLHHLALTNSQLPTIPHQTLQIPSSLSTPTVPYPTPGPLSASHSAALSSKSGNGTAGLNGRTPGLRKLGPHTPKFTATSSPSTPLVPCHLLSPTPSQPNVFLSTTTATGQGSDLGHGTSGPSSGPSSRPAAPSALPGYAPSDPGQVPAPIPFNITFEKLVAPARSSRTTASMVASSHAVTSPTGGLNGVSTGSTPLGAAASPGKSEKPSGKPIGPNATPTGPTGPDGAVAAISGISTTPATAPEAGGVSPNVGTGGGLHTELESSSIAALAALSSPPFDPLHRPHSPTRTDGDLSTPPNPAAQPVLQFSGSKTPNFSPSVPQSALGRADLASSGLLAGAGSSSGRWATQGGQRTAQTPQKLPQSRQVFANPPPVNVSNFSTLTQAPPATLSASFSLSGFASSNTQPHQQHQGQPLQHFPSHSRQHPPPRGLNSQVVGPLGSHFDLQRTRLGAFQGSQHGSSFQRPPNLPPQPTPHHPWTPSSATGGNGDTQNNTESGGTSDLVHLLPTPGSGVPQAHTLSPHEPHRQHHGHDPRSPGFDLDALSVDSYQSSGEGGPNSPVGAKSHQGGGLGSGHPWRTGSDGKSSGQPQANAVELGAQAPHQSFNNSHGCNRSSNLYHVHTPQLSVAGRSFGGSVTGSVSSRLLGSANKPAITSLAGATAVLSPGGIRHHRPLQGQTGGAMGQHQRQIILSPNVSPVEPLPFEAPKVDPEALEQTQQQTSDPQPGNQSQTAQEPDFEPKDDASDQLLQASQSEPQSPPGTQSQPEQQSQPDGQTQAEQQPQQQQESISESPSQPLPRQESMSEPDVSISLVQEAELDSKKEAKSEPKLELKSQHDRDPPLSSEEMSSTQETEPFRSIEPIETPSEPIESAGMTPDQAAPSEQSQKTVIAEKSLECQQAGPKTQDGISEVCDEAPSEPSGPNSGKKSAKRQKKKSRR